MVGDVGVAGRRRRRSRRGDLVALIGLVLAGLGLAVIAYQVVELFRDGEWHAVPVEDAVGALGLVPVGFDDPTPKSILAWYLDSPVSVTFIVAGLILAAIAVPGLLRARMAGNEASAIGSLRAINSSQQAFASSCGHGNYAADLTILGVQPATGGAAFISPDLSAAAVISKSGFNTTIAGATAAPASTPDSRQGDAAGANQITVKLGDPPASYEAEVVGTDPATDLALLRIRAEQTLARDLVPNMLFRNRRGQGFADVTLSNLDPAQGHVEDAEALSYPDGSFDFGIAPFFVTLAAQSLAPGATPT